jgi:hypothetical protein
MPFGVCRAFFLAFIKIYSDTERGYAILWSVIGRTESLTLYKFFYEFTG